MVLAVPLLLVHSCGDLHHWLPRCYELLGTGWWSRCRQPRLEYGKCVATSNSYGLTHDPAIQIRAERKQRQPEKEGLVPGPVQALPAPEDADKYVVVKKKDAEKKEEKQ